MSDALFFPGAAVAPAIGWLNATMHGVFKAISVAVETLLGAAETVLLALPGR